MTAYEKSGATQSVFDLLAGHISETLPQAPDAINADLMTTAEIHTQLQEDFDDIDAFLELE